MYKLKKYSLYLITFIYFILCLIEGYMYFTTPSNIYGIYYLCLNILIIFFLVPVCYNYKRHFSKTRISKLIIIILLGIFSSYILHNVVLNSIDYMDDSQRYIDKIFVIKDVLKVIIYSLIILFTIIESKVISTLKMKYQLK